MKTQTSLIPRSASAAGKTVPAILFAVGALLALTRSADAQTNEQIKWNQPPAPLTVTSNLFYGWNEPSVYGKQIAADDWVCTTTNPVTALRWWGSFLNWQSNTPPKLPAAFNIAIWTDVPAGPTGMFSHPGRVIWRIDCTSFTWEFVGWDYDPRMNTYEACFRFEQNLLPQEWFYQAPGANGTNIFWISIAAVYPQGEPEQPFGWKTRPRDPRSPAPDDAVRITSPNAPDLEKTFESGEPIWWPTPEDSWDLAFELISSYGSTVRKWEQPPDLQPTGLDVNDSLEPQPPYLLADDFQCTATGPLTDITIWGSWYHDLLPGSPTNVIFTLSIHSDIPAQQSPTGYSMPGAMLWMHTFQPGQFAWRVRQRDIPEGWLTPPAGYEPVGDYVCHQYDFHVDPTIAFVQQGSPARPVVYWLDVQARPIGAAAEAKFGWKTSVSNWNDTAVWVNASEPYVGTGWQKLIYPPEHPLKGDIGLSFRVATEQSVQEVKWSQPPAPYTPPDAFNGWNEYSVYGYQQIVADDWVCTNANPVTDIHWWGSYLGWGESRPPQVPDAFHVAIWTDVPRGPNTPFSHPGQVVWETLCTNFTWQFVGWDIDPRDLAAAPEACFKFDQQLSRDEWFHQDPANGTNIYWISIAAVYKMGTPPPYPWGWKTRPRDQASPAPDDAVKISLPVAPHMGSLYEQGEPLEFPKGVSWDTAFVLTTQPVAPDLDFGDAPSPYPTLLANNGARHIVVPWIFLGNRIDAEADGQPDPNALGDDNHPPMGPDDEDGVTFTSVLRPAQLATVDVVASTNGLLNAWLDFNADGDWADPGEQIFTNVVLNPGVNSLTFRVSSSAPAGPTFARFRFSTAANLSFDGLTKDGEVEDYQVRVEPPEQADLGDAPDSSNSWGTRMTAYPGVLADFPTVYQAGSPPFGPIHHQPKQMAFLGTNVSVEMEADIGVDQDGVNNLIPPNDLANLDGADDGVLFPLRLFDCVPTTFQYQVTVVTPSTLTYYVNVWFDWNRDGDWNDMMQCPGGNMAPEWAVQNQPLTGLPAGVHMLTTPPFVSWHPPTANPPVWMRITLSEQPWPPTGGGIPDAGAGPAQGYQFGETEDYYVTNYVREELDFGDAPDPRYPTLLTNNGARHIIVPGVFLGNRIDAEPDGQPNATATGDDLAGMPDEDGVVFTSPLVPGQPATVKVVASVAGRLNAWIDFNDNLTWADPGEQIFVDRPLNPGPNMLAFLVPAGAQPGATTFARFRFNTAGNLGFTGLALDGEVEDYQMKIEPRFTKYIQYPDTTENGMDVLATSPNILADDFICTNRGPITDLHIWASWLDDKVDTNAMFWLGIWTDVPQAPSHPGRLLWSSWFRPGEYQARPFVAADERFFDPNSGTFLGSDRQVWQYDFFPKAAFLEEGTPNTPIVYWVSVTAVTDKDTVFGWKTSTNHFNDDAVFGHLNNGVPMGDWRELRDPITQRSLDLAFAITTIQTNWPPCPDPKLFVMPPETAPSGLDVLASSAAATLLADDFICTNAGWITNIVVWGSWSNDLASQSVSFQLALWSDVPATNGEPSHPGKLIASRWFPPGEYRLRERIPASESFYDPNLDRITGGDTMIHGYEFFPTNVFWQTGSPEQPKIYWLSVIAQTTNQLFGWKTSLSRFQDAAVFGHVDTNWTAKGDWRPMRHPTLGHPLNLAFSIATDTRAPYIQWIVRDNNLVVITWTACPGSLYRVQYRKNLEVAGWNDLPGDVLALGTSAEKSDLITYDRCFYRVLLLP